MADPEQQAEETPQETPEETPPEKTPEEIALEIQALETQKSDLIHDITGLRSTRRNLQNAPPPEIPDKSPLQLEAERLGVSEDEVEMTGGLWKKQDAWKEAQKEKQTQKQQMEQYNQAAQVAEATLTDEVCGKGLGLKSLEAMGEHLLTDGDRLDIFRAGARCGEVALKKLRYRIIEAGGQNANVLKERIAALKPKKKPTEKTPEEEEPPSQEEVLTMDEAQIAHTFGL